MNIFWIEDNPKIEDLKEEYFFKCEHFNKNIDQIHTANSFDDAYNLASVGEEKFDLVVIDINLENFNIGKHGKGLYDKFGDIETQEDFLREAGFHLYLDLYKMGFGNDKIVFLTGNTDTTNIQSTILQLNESIENGGESEIDTAVDELRKKLDDKKYHIIEKLVEEGNVHNLNKYLREIGKEYETDEEKGMDTYSKFEKRFQSARLNSPLSINKSDVDKFHNWLENKLTKKYKNFEYCTLRRGIIEACTFLKEELEKKRKQKNSRINDPKNIDLLINPCKNYILFNKTLEDEKKDLDCEFIYDYLTKFEVFLPLRIPNNKEQRFYRLLREISSIWEMSKGHFLLKNPVEFWNVGNNTEYYFKNFCQQEMKLLRNWTAHNQYSDNITEKEIAYFFMIAMRGLFDIDMSEILNFEVILGSLFDHHNWTIKEIENLLQRSYYDLRNMFQNNKYNPDKNDFNSIIRTIGSNIGTRVYEFDVNEVRRKSKKIFYQNFWHGIFPANLYVAKPKTDTSGVAMFINFRIDDLNKNSFPYFLGRCIYNESFE